jgi:HK97 family phage portal protein
MNIAARIGPALVGGAMAVGGTLGLVAAGPIGALVGGSLGGSLAFGGSMLFGRTAGWRLFMNRTRIDYRREIGDPAENSIVGAVVGWISRNFPEAPVRIVHEDTTDIAYSSASTGPGFMLRLLERPNPYFSGVLQWMATVVDWICEGNAYWIKVRNRAGRVVELWWVPARMIEPRWPLDDPTVFISHYSYRVDGVDYAIPVRDVVHFRNGLDPRNTRKGLSRLGSLFREIFTDEEAANFTASLLRNLGIPGVIIAPANTTGGTQVRAEPKVIKEKFMELFGGDHRGEPMVLTSPTEVKVLSFNPQEMDLRELRKVPEERVSAVLGVPVGVAQLGAGLDRNTFTNYGEANVAAYTQGVIPSQRIFAAEIEVQLLPEWADLEAEALDVWFDWTKASAMASAAAELWKRLESSATKGLITRAVFKKGTGQRVDAGDDVYILPNNYLVVPAGGNAPGGTSPPAAFRATVGYPQLEAERLLLLGGDERPGPDPIVTREQVIATRERLEAAGEPAGYDSLAKHLSVSPATIRRRLAQLST